LPGLSDSFLAGFSSTSLIQVSNEYSSSNPAGRPAANQVARRRAIPTAAAPHFGFYREEKARAPKPRKYLLFGESMKRIDTKQPIIKKVHRLILETARGKGKIRVFLPPEEYKDFVREVEPLYKQQYGALIAEESAAAEGFENVLFAGAAVCLLPTPPASA
jgi:hypothetical protein